MKTVPKPAAVAIVIGALLLVAAAGYFLLISPQRSRSAELAKEAETVQAEILARRAASRHASQVEPIRVADLFRVSKAMPSTDDMPGVLLELNRIARQTGIRFDSITPHEPSNVDGYQRRPIDLIFDGNFYELSDFLFRLRSLVRVRGGELQATGRLFTVNSLNFVESERAFPQIKATISISAFVYGTGEATAPAAQPPAGQPLGTQPPTQPVSPAQPTQVPAAQPSPSTPPSGATAVGAQ